MAEIAVRVPGAVGEIERWMKTIPPSREGERNGEGAGVKVRRNLFAEPLLCTSSLVEGTDLAGGCGLATHSPPLGPASTRSRVAYVVLLHSPTYV